MTTTMSTPTPISPAEVHETLARHILADGFDLVFDYEKSHGSWVHDSRTGREFLDFLTFFGSIPIGYNHPRMKDPEFLAEAKKLKFDETYVSGEEIEKYVADVLAVTPKAKELLSFLMVTPKK